MKKVRFYRGVGLNHLQEYEIEAEETMYQLKGINTLYDSSQFLPCTELYFAMADKIPQVGLPFSCTQLIISNGTITPQDIVTSPVEQIDIIAPNTYQVITSNNIYVTKIGV